MMRETAALLRLQQYDLAVAGDAFGAKCAGDVAGWAEAGTIPDLVATIGADSAMRRLDEALDVQEAAL